LALHGKPTPPLHTRSLPAALPSSWDRRALRPRAFQHRPSPEHLEDVYRLGERTTRLVVTASLTEPLGSFEERHAEPERCGDRAELGDRLVQTAFHLDLVAPHRIELRP